MKRLIGGVIVIIILTVFTFYILDTIGKPPGWCGNDISSTKDALEKANQFVGSKITDEQETCFGYASSDYPIDSSIFTAAAGGRNVHLICDSSIEGCTIEEGALTVTEKFFATISACCTETDCYVGIGTTDFPCGQ